MIGSAEEIKETASLISLNDFRLIKELGRGAFGRVYLSEHIRTGTKYALKAIRKDQILQHGIVDKIMQEKDILLSC